MSKLSVSNLHNWDKKKKQADINRVKANEKRRDISHRKNAGIWKPSNGITAPVWFLNIYKSWSSYSNCTPQNAWDKWKRFHLDNSGVDREPKKSPGRPPLPDHLRKTPTVKTNRNAKMEQLLLDNNIHVVRTSKYGVAYLKEYPTVELMINGRLLLEDKTKISVHYFLNNLVT